MRILSYSYVDVDNCRDKSLIRGENAFVTTETKADQAFETIFLEEMQKMGLPEEYLGKYIAIAFGYSGRRLTALTFPSVLGPIRNRTEEDSYLDDVLRALSTTHEGKKWLTDHPDEIMLPDLFTFTQSGEVTVAVATAVLGLTARDADIETKRQRMQERILRENQDQKDRHVRHIRRNRILTQIPFWDHVAAEIYDTDSTAYDSCAVSISEQLFEPVPKGFHDTLLQLSVFRSGVSGADMYSFHYQLHPDQVKSNEHQLGRIREVRNALLESECFDFDRGAYVLKSPIREIFQHIVRLKGSDYAASAHAAAAGHFESLITEHGTTRYPDSAVFWQSELDYHRAEFTLCKSNDKTK